MINTSSYDKNIDIQRAKTNQRLPSYGASQRIADELGIKVETVRNYFGGHNFKDGRSAGINIQPGPDGGIVELNDSTILDKAREILAEYEASKGEA